MTHESRVFRFRACRQWFCEYVRRIVLGGDILRRNLRVFKHIVFHKHFLVCDVAGSITICRALADVNRNLIVHLQFCWLVLFESKFIQEFACPEYLLCCKTAGEIFGLCCGEYRSWLNCAFPSKSCTGSKKGSHFGIDHLSHNWRLIHRKTGLHSSPLGSLCCRSGQGLW